MHVAQVSQTKKGLVNSFTRPLWLAFTKLRYNSFLVKTKPSSNQALPETEIKPVDSTNSWSSPPPDGEEIAFLGNSCSNILLPR